MHVGGQLLLDDLRWSYRGLGMTFYDYEKGKNRGGKA